MERNTVPSTIPTIRTMKETEERKHSGRKEKKGKRLERTEIHIWDRTFNTFVVGHNSFHEVTW